MLCGSKWENCILLAAGLIVRNLWPYLLDTDKASPEIDWWILLASVKPKSRSNKEKSAADRAATANAPAAPSAPAAAAAPALAMPLVGQLGSDEREKLLAANRELQSQAGWGWPEIRIRPFQWKPNNHSQIFFLCTCGAGQVALRERELQVFNWRSQADSNTLKAQEPPVSVRVFTICHVFLPAFLHESSQQLAREVAW